MTTPIIEEMVEEFWKRYGASDERKDWLRTALTTIDQNAREEERELMMDVCGDDDDCLDTLTEIFDAVDALSHPLNK